ncbi:MAG: hypothetical protein B9S32_10135 [Verrucomicrobia bacterium Tous-C9LFEB]|nr:MAG: hypothetical protein B9S32_10135 [Verrucomicrobia bacterium Tous-C9LFEB]
MKTNRNSPIPHWPVLTLGAMLTTGLLISACSEQRSAKTPPPDKKLTTPETLVGDMRKNEYKENPTPENARKMDHAMAELDSEIRELQELTKRTSGSEKARAEEKLVLLQRKRDELARDYNEAKYRAAVDEAKEAVRNFGEALKNAVTPDSNK